MAMIKIQNTEMGVFVEHLDPKLWTAEEFQKEEIIDLIERKPKHVT